MQLFRKPANPTGQLELVEEGLRVLASHPGPFAIISAVGPTRTGKSSILGRSFLRGSSAGENAFEIGRGVTSYTGGVWILTKPVTLHTPRGDMHAFIVDTEGFHGIGGRTSKTYARPTSSLSHALCLSAPLLTLISLIV